MRYIFIFVIMLGVCVQTQVYAQTVQDSVPHKFSLFHPTPKHQVRSFETDQPDATESSIVVDKGGYFSLKDSSPTVYFLGLSFRL